MIRAEFIVYILPKHIEKFFIKFPSNKSQLLTTVIVATLSIVVVVDIVAISIMRCDYKMLKSFPWPCTYRGGPFGPLSRLPPSVCWHLTELSR